MSVTKENAHAVYREAYHAAVDAASAPVSFQGCGFAYVNIKPARGAMVNLLKELEIGEQSSTGGYDVWNPSGNHTQCMVTKERGAQAFANVLKSHGVKCVAKSYLD